MTFGEMFDEYIGEEGMEALLSFLSYEEYDKLFGQWVASHKGIDALGHCKECGEGVDIDFHSSPMCVRCQAQEDYDNAQFQKGKEQAYEAGR